ncbi:MAG TPA: hypothetical protein EYP85_07055, partial [Armatimonadetes bacterium]|nr:hypothetical protein [Armatimonadota bacterium]
WEDQGYPDYDGFAWYRRQVELPTAPPDEPVHLDFEGVDGRAWVYWNGELVGQHEGWDEPFRMTVPAEKVRRTQPNLLAVRVWDGAGPGGIYREVTVGIARGD